MQYRFEMKNVLDQKHYEFNFFINFLFNLHIQKPVYILIIITLCNIKISIFI